MEYEWNITYEIVIGIITSDLHVLIHGKLKLDPTLQKKKSVQYELCINKTVSSQC